MPSEQFYNRVGALQTKLGEAKSIGKTADEIATLFEIARLSASEGDRGLANMHFDLAARVIKRTGIGLDKLHEALGERALILRRAERYAESLDLYKQAAAAAEQHAGPLEQARWVGKQGGIHRLMDKPDLAREAFSKAMQLFSELGRKGLAGVADQEGNLGLLASDIGDDRAAEESYRRAVELAIKAHSTPDLNTWATNLANALSRKRRYHEAWSFYKKAMSAALKTGDYGGIRRTATEWSASYRNAHRSLDAAEVLIAAADHIENPSAKYELLDQAIADLQLAGEWNRLIAIATEVLALLKAQRADAKLVSRCESLRKAARDRMKADRKVTKAADRPTTLDILIPANMARYEESNNAEGMRQIAHLVCDIGLGLGNADEETWQSILSDTSLRYRVVSDAMKALCNAGLPEKSLELSQRFKSLGFCLPNIERARRTKNPAAAGYLKRLSKLANAVAGLKGPARPDGLQRADAVRAAGEMVLEESEKLRGKDRVLHAKLGGLIRPAELLNALPAGDPVAIVDLVVGSDFTIIHILERQGDKVLVVHGVSPVFTAKDALDLLQVWAQSGIAGEISERQREGLIKIGKTLHDKLCCSLAKTLADRGIAQMIVIPDGLTRHLPLHLSGVCGKEINIPGIKTDDAQILGEAFPVEYAPCLQAVAISEHQKRPREVKVVLSLADPKSNLPGARKTADALGSRVPASVNYTSFLREEATLSNLSTGIDKADIVFIGAHGIFKPANPGDSYVELHDGRWTMAEMLDRPAFGRSPVIILSACEVGASAPGDELAASGIPGALISAGAACVLGGLWPLEDISTGYAVEKFLDYLSHRGYRPAAALFRALRDLRQLPKNRAIERCQSLLEKMDEDGTADSLVEQYLRLNELKERIEDSDAEHPFASPQFWGGLVIIGSGWASPAGAIVSASPTQPIEDLLKREEAQALLSTGKFKDAKKILDEILLKADGAERARLLNALAAVVWGGRRKGTDKSSRREAMELLAEAEDLAKADQNEQLLRNINATRQKIDL